MQAGNTAHIQYTLAADLEGKNYELQMDDYMYLFDEYAMINTHTRKKIGLPVGKTVIFIQKQ